MVEETKTGTTMATTSTDAPVPTQSTKFCSSCGAQINEKAEICPKCGVRVAPVPSLKDPKSRTTAMILAFFLGGIGIHKLYLGSGKWWLYLIFCWTFIPAIIALIEFIQYAMMSDAAFHSKYG